MAIDYKKELENAAKTMILVHEPQALIKLIVRIIVQRVKISHAGILLHCRENDTYILTVSRGPTGQRIPQGFARMDADNALIRFFRERKSKSVEFLISKKNNPGKDELLKKALYQMEIFDAVVCIPSYFRNELLGLLLLGKKTNSRVFAKDELSFFIALASDVAMAIRNAQLFNELEFELEKNKRLFIHTIIALAAAIDAKDHYTHGHTSRVTSLSLEIAKKMAQKDKALADAKFLENLHIAGLLHDIGKIGTPESILNKEGPLDEAERQKMKEHPKVGAAILAPIKELEFAINGVKYHHERFDGSGYPEGLDGKNIPLIAAIISVADTFDAMITDRPYRKGLSRQAAAEEIKRVSGRQLNPEIVSSFLEIYG